MKSLTTDQIIDYMVCGLFYHCRHIDHEPERINSRDILASRFENTLKRVASYFFYKKQGDTVPSYSSLLNRWEKLWFPKDMTAYDLAVEQHEVAHHNMASYSNVASASLENFYERFASDEATPVLVNEEFLIPLTEGTRLEGEIDLVLKANGSYKLIKWYARRTRKFGKTTPFDMAALGYAFNFRTESNLPVEYYVYNLADPSSNALKRIDIPHVADIDALRFWASKIEREEEYVPRRGFTSYCKGCPFDETCLNYIWAQDQTVA